MIIGQNMQVTMGIANIMAITSALLNSGVSFPRNIDRNEEVNILITYILAKAGRKNDFFYQNFRNDYYNWKEEVADYTSPLQIPEVLEHYINEFFNYKVIEFRNMDSNFFVKALYSGRSLLLPVLFGDESLVDIHLVEVFNFQAKFNNILNCLHNRCARKLKDLDIDNVAFYDPIGNFDQLVEKYYEHEDGNNQIMSYKYFYQHWASKEYYVGQKCGFEIII